MKKTQSSVVCVVTVVLLLLGHEAKVSMAVTCNASQLSSCAGAILTGTPASATCCSKIKEQRPCLCQYIRDPNLKRFINAGNAQKVARQCNVPFPSC